jgi:hypothetical protein
MSDHKEHIEEIAQEAAKLYEQDWNRLDTGTRARWIETVRHTTRGGGDNHMERLAGQAIDNWYKRQEEVAALPPTPTPKKRGR